MKLFLAALLVVVSCLLFISAQETATTSDLEGVPDTNNGKNARFFFNFISDPCGNMFYRMLGMADAKCSLQCYIQAGYQQGGYCDTNNVCQCNVIA